MRNLLVALAMLLGPVISAHAQVSVDIGFPSVNIGINVPAYPDLVLVPGYPVYYDPRANSNYFYYDGLYWVYQGDNWYMSSWYNGPWQLVGPESVPLFVLRVPVRYYRQPPVYFRGWPANAAPRWGEHWGHDWEQRRGGWDQWDHRSGPPAAPLPVYQRQYAGDRYPRAVEQQHLIRSENYRYQPHEAVTRQHYQQQGSPRPEPQHQSPAPRMQHNQAAPGMQGHPAAPPQGHQAPPQEGHQAAPQQQGHRAAPHDKGQGNKNQEHGQERN